jgi:hypothetical protein
MGKPEVAVAPNVTGEATVAPLVGAETVTVTADEAVDAGTFTLRVLEPYPPLESQARITTLCVPGEMGKLVWMLLVRPALYTLTEST